MLVLLCILEFTIDILLWAVVASVHFQIGPLGVWLAIENVGVSFMNFFFSSLFLEFECFGLVLWCFLCFRCFFSRRSLVIMASINCFLSAPMMRNKCIYEAYII